MSVSIDVLILAGGQSRRMGKSKALLPVAESTLLENLVEQLPFDMLKQLWISGDPHYLPIINSAQYLVDYLPKKFQGPLSGIASALHASKADYVFILSCDILQLPKNTLRQLLKQLEQTPSDIIYARSLSGRDYPLIALWHTRITNKLISYLNLGERKVMQFIDQTTSIACVMPLLHDVKCNINTEKDFEEALTLLT